MADWDTTLKLIFTESADRVMSMLGETAAVRQWLSVELPKTTNLRVDLLADLTSGRLRHIELQSTNAPDIPFRMLRYSVAIYDSERRFPIQTLIYTGNEPLRMENCFREEGLDYHFNIIDLKMLDGSGLLESERISDNLLGLLMANCQQARIIRRILDRILRLNPSRRNDAIERLLLTCGMRKLASVASEEIKKMPITFDIMEDPYFAELVHGAMERGAEQGREQGLEQGLEQGRRTLLRFLLQRRFGELPAWVDDRLAACPPQGIDDLASRLLDCASLDQVFGRT